MRQDQLDGLIVFATVAETHGFSTAGVRLGISPSAVSQAVRQLEKRLGFALFHRTTRSIALTELGARYLERVAPAIQVLIGAANDLGDDSSPPSGHLRINLARAAFMIVLRPILPGFLQSYPGIKVELTLDNSLVDIVAPGYDAGIRFGNLVEKDMVGIPVGPKLAGYLLASPEYLARRGRPEKPQDLASHDCIGFRHVSSGLVERWDLARDDERMALSIDGPLIVNDSTTLVHLALDGLGIVYMINGYVESLIEAGRLVRVLPHWSPPQPGFSLYYPDRNRASRPLRALVDCLQDARDQGVTGAGQVFV